jgi:hypothetical protein
MKECNAVDFGWRYFKTVILWTALHLGGRCWSRGRIDLLLDIKRTTTIVMVEEAAANAQVAIHATTTATCCTDADEYYRAGDVVCTAYGVGVIVQKIQKPKSVEGNNKKKNDDDDDDVVEFFAVRLWRIPGKSMGSSALALLQPSTVCYVPS